MANIIKIKRGLSSNISNATLEQGELAITTDTQDLYVGTDSGNKKVGGGPKNILDGTKSGSIRTINSAVEDSTYTLGKNAFSEGSGTRASGTNSHAEGSNALASGDRAHAEGELTVASGTDSHAEGYHTKASNFYSHAEGIYTTASGNRSHAEGAYTIAQGDSQHVQGKYNIADTTSAHIVGNGDNTTQSNAHTLDWSRNACFAGDGYIVSTSGKNKDEGSKILATKEYVDSKTSANYTYDKTYHIMPQSEITTPAGTTAFTQDSSARTFTAVGAEGVTYKNEITLSDSVSNILISSLGSLIEDVGPADQNAKIDITDTSGVVSNILDKKGCSEDLINTGPLASGSKITLTYVSGSYKPTNAQQIFTLEYYAKETTDSELTSFVSSLIDLESTARRQADRSLQKNIDTETFNLQTQIFNLQENAMPIEQDSVTYQVENNFEYRFFGPSNSGVTHLGISFENVSLTSGDKFKTSVIFQTTSSGCTFEITESASVKVKLTGDDVTNGVLNPVASKVYEIAFYWNGFFMSGVVRGVNFAAPMNKITITNGNSMTGLKYANDVEIYQDYDSSTGVFSNLLATISSEETSEIFTPKNEIYPKLVANGSEANSLSTSNLTNCTDLGELELGSTTNKQGLRIRIDSSPASVKIIPGRSNEPIK